MKLQEVDINKAQGLRLAEELTLYTTVLPRNHILTKDDIALLKQFGRKTIFTAEAEIGDIDFDTALGVAAAKITGKNLGYRIDERGFCEIAATTDGLLEAYPDRIGKFNRFCTYFILNTIEPFQIVKKGTIIARLEILLPVISQEMVDELVFALSGNETLLNIRDMKQQNAALLLTHFYNDDNEAFHFDEVRQKLTETYQPLNIHFSVEANCDHTAEDIAVNVETLLQSANDVVFVIAGMRNYAPQDVVLSALNSLTDSVLCSQIPLLGGSDLIIATKRNKKIICLPYNYAYIDSPVMENFIKLALVKPKLLAYDFNRPANAVIESLSQVKDLSSLIKGNDAESKNKANIAAVVLAAGQSKRIGKNKLLADLDDRPLLIKAVEAAIKSDASPVFVVTGYQAEEVEAELENYDINIVYNPNYYTGVKTSINLGLKSVPDFCEGALLIPADMPGLSAELLNKMIAKFKKKQENQLIIAENKGIKCNPILWSKALYQRADLVAENADVRPIFMEHADYTTLVKGTASELLDVNFQNDLDQARKKLSDAG